MTDQTSETTPDGLDVAAVRERASAARSGEWKVRGCDVIAPWQYVTHDVATCHGSLPEGNRANAEFIAHARTDIPLLLAALDEAERALSIFRTSGAVGLLVRAEAAEARAAAAESARDAAEGVVREVRALHRPIPIYPGDCESPDDDHGFDPAEEFCRDCPVEFEACGECREEDGSWIEWPCETALAVDPNRWVDDLVRAAALAAADETEGEA